jgi:POLQ-like helicase
MTVDDAVALAPRTLEYFLADKQTKERLVSLFRILAENISSKVSEPDRRKLYGRTLYGVSVSQAIEAWVRTHLSELVSADIPTALLAVVWPLLRTHNQNAAFKKCNKPEALATLAVEWISGRPFNAILKSLTDQGVRLVWGKTF